MKHRKSTGTDDGIGSDSEIWCLKLARHEKDSCVYASVHLSVHVELQKYGPLYCLGIVKAALKDYISG